MREKALNFKRVSAEIGRFPACRRARNQRADARGQRTTAAIASAARSTLCELSAATQIRPVSIA